MSDRSILSIFYFISLGIVGLELSYLPLYGKYLGCTDFQISVLVASSFVANAIFIIPWAFYADRIQRLKMMVTTGLFACLIVAVTFPFIKTAGLFIAAFYLFIMLQAVIYPQVETLTIHTGHREGFHYGSVRAVGSMGFVITAFVFGWIVNWRGIIIVPVLYLTLVTAQLLSALTFPKDEEKKEQHVTCSQIKGIISKKEIVLFMIACVLILISHGIYFGFFSIWLSQNGHSPAMIGTLWSITIAAEVIGLWKGHYFLDKWGAETLFLVSMVICGFRWMTYYLSPLLGVILIGQLLNFFSYGTFHLSAMNIVTKHFPRHARQTGVAIYTASSFGVGAAIGTLGAGLIVPRFGIAPLFLWCSMVAWIAALVFLPVVLGNPERNRK